MNSEKWKCENCDKTGVVDIPKGAGVTEGILLIMNDHKKKSPDCGWDVRKVRMIT